MPGGRWGQHLGLGPGRRHLLAMGVRLLRRITSRQPTGTCPMSLGTRGEGGDGGCSQATFLAKVWAMGLRFLP